MRNAKPEKMPAAKGALGKDPTLRARAQNAVRDAILDGRFGAGRKLVERELCALTGASRSVLREALANLEACGLIERQSYAGYRVARLTSRKVFEIFELRASLETQAAELFTERASAQEIAALGQALSELERCFADFDLRRTRKAKERYYEVLFTGCRNDEIGRALSSVIDRICYLRCQLLSDPDRRKDSLADMRRLTVALSARDRLAARAASLAHLEAARDAVLQLMSQNETERGSQAA